MCAPCAARTTSAKRIGTWRDHAVGARECARATSVHKGKDWCIMIMIIMIIIVIVIIMIIIIIIMIILAWPHADDHELQILVEGIRGHGQGLLLIVMMLLLLLIIIIIITIIIITY